MLGEELFTNEQKVAICSYFDEVSIEVSFLFYTSTHALLLNRLSKLGLRNVEIFSVTSRFHCFLFFLIVMFCVGTSQIL